MSPRLISLLGVACFVGLAWAFSTNRRRFPWRTVAVGLGLQFTLAVVILKTTFGRSFFELSQRAVVRLIGFANQGAQMVFGPLADQKLLGAKLGPDNASIFAITVSVTIIVVSALSALLYHWGILQRIVRGTAWLMQRAMRTSGSESLAAAANIFMGMTEAPLVIKPYLAGMTRSELMALMVGGMATIAGGVMAAYVSFGVQAGHLLTASVMSAPAGLLIAKIMVPESETSPTANGATTSVTVETRNGLDALCRGASDGMMLALNVLAMLVAFVAIVALVNYLLGWLQAHLFHLYHLGFKPVTLQDLFGWFNAPLAWLMGVPLADCHKIGQVLGERIVLNEFFGYISLTSLQHQGVLAARSITLATYALCGFANFGSIAIQIGGIGSLAPQRRGDLALLGMRSMIGGLLACYLTAAVVGVLW